MGWQGQPGTWAVGAARRGRGGAFRWELRIIVQLKRQASKTTRRCVSSRGAPGFGVLLGAALLAVLGGAAAPGAVRQAQAVQDIGLPDMGTAADRTLSPYLERHIGKQLLRHLWGNNAVINDALVQEYMTRTGSRLLLRSGRSPADFTFLVVADNRINAFAAPGGVLGINSGTILAAESVHELAAVTAHEIAHVTQKHIARSEHTRQGLRLPLTASLLAAILLGSYNPELGQAAVAVTAASQIQQHINFTRANEQEADRIGMQYLQRAGYDPHGMPAFFGRMLKQSRLHSQDDIPEYLRTHPLTVNRIAESKSLAASYDQARGLPELDFQLVRARLSAATESNQGAVLQRFKDQLRPDADPGAVSQQAARYGYALVLARMGHLEQALAELRLLERMDKTSLFYLLALGELTSATGRVEESLEILGRAALLHPDSALPWQAQARTLLRARRPAEAQHVLRDYGRKQGGDVFHYRLLAQAEAEAGFKTDSDIARAQVLFLQGSTKKAVELLELSLQQKHLNSYQDARLRARLAELRGIMELDKKLRF